MSEITLHAGDNRDSLRRLIDQGIRVHSVVTDPPYGLTSITKRFGKDNAAPALSNGATGVFKRASGGFMGQQWDASGIERDPEFWRLIYDILLPGGYVLAFSSPRTGHWQACAMEMAGFVMHPFFGWCYGSGFPKAHNAAMAIDKVLKVEGGRGEPKSAAHAGWIDRGAMRGDEGNEGWQRDWMSDADKVEANARKYLPGSEEAAQWEGWAYGGQSMKPALEPVYFAQKPFSEKNGALNLLKHGVGAVNIDATRVNATATSQCSVGSNLRDSKVCTCHLREGYQTDRSVGNCNQASASLRLEPDVNLQPNVHEHGHEYPESLDSLFDCPSEYHSYDAPAQLVEVLDRDASPSQRDDDDNFLYNCAECGHIHADLSKPSVVNTTPNVESKPKGRHPANLIHDDSDEVRAMFPNDSARFFNGFPFEADPLFYHAKASKADRAGSKHPTVKPVALMQHFVRLATPPGGIVLDPFGGSGTTAEAARREGFDCILMEADERYISDIRNRFGIMHTDDDDFDAMFS